ncbi:hypothetical protein ACFWMG_00115 [Streptomyces sp. NPDC127074]
MAKVTPALMVPLRLMETWASRWTQTRPTCGTKRRSTPDTRPVTTV